MIPQAGKRLTSTLALWALVALIVIYAGRTGVVIALTAFTAAAQWELYVMLEKLGHRPFRVLGVALGVLLLTAPYFMRLYLEPGGAEGMSSTLVAITIVACALRVMHERTGSNRLETLIATVFGLVYIPFMLSFLIAIMWLGGTEIFGIMLMIWLVVATKFCDVGALVVGSLIGKHKLAPTMSPAKTWEGAIGGVLVSAGMGAALVATFRSAFPATFTPLYAAIMAIPPAAVSITSDLIESVIKRMAGCKDSGRTIPGIGGAFDLVDSLVLAAPVGYLLLRIVL